jgi:predicted ArsR family transcriptional regulator
MDTMALSKSRPRPPDACRADPEEVRVDIVTTAGETDRTSARVVRSLLADGPTTASGLAERLGLTPAAVRRHLDALVAAGQVEARDRAPYGPAPQRGRGRPPRVWALTPEGRDAFPQAYDDLAIAALRHLADTEGAEAVAAFARAQSRAMEERFADVAALPPADRVAALVAALTSDGYAASVDPAPAGEQLCQHHCPVAHVAAEFPQLCEAETEAFGRLLGRHVQRLSTIGAGGHVCTTAVPAPRPPASAPTSERDPAHPEPHREPHRQPERTAS